MPLGSLALSSFPLLNLESAIALQPVFPSHSVSLPPDESPASSRTELPATDGLATQLLNDWFARLLETCRWYRFSGLGYVLFLTLTVTALVLSVAEQVLAALYPGDRGPDVVTLQSNLQDAGYNPGPIDGVYGDLTEIAVRQFQRDRNLVVDGVVGEQTLSVLQSPSAPVVSDGSAGVGQVPSQGAHIIELQQLLTSQGFYSGGINGIYGPLTQQAVEAAQAAYGLTVDGIAGPRTMAALRGVQTQRSDDPSVSAANPNSPTVPVPRESTSPAASSSVDVAELQKLLTDQGFYNGPISGIYGPMTRQAVRDAQAAYGLVVDGIAGSQTMAALRGGTANSALPSVAAAPAPAAPTATSDSLLNVPTPPPQELPGSLSGATTDNSSLNVVYLQQLLNRRGFYQGPIDGVYSDRTRSAVSQAQQAFGLAVDGIAGPQTIQALRQG